MVQNCDVLVRDLERLENLDDFASVGKPASTESASRWFSYNEVEREL